MIKFNEPYLTGKEEASIAEVFRNREFGGNGPFTERCQALLERRFGVAKVLLTHSCTAALEMSALLSHLGPGDEVILPSYTFTTTASSMLRTGATLVFAEIDPHTQMLDMADVERRITPRTRAIVPVHYAGIAADMERLETIVAGRNIDIIEDAAQGLGSALGGAPLGTLGRFGCISFHHTKNLHAGLAGALYVNRAEDIDEATWVWERGTNRKQFVEGVVDKYTWVALGSSFYPTEMQAAMLLAQLETLDENTAQRRAIWECYRDELGALAQRGIAELPPIGPNREINYHAFALIFATPAMRETVRKDLAARGIQAPFHYIPLHSSPMGEKLGYRHDDLPVTESIAERVLRLPLHFELTLDDARTVARAVREAAGLTQRIDV
jgi:dTDP-4-amino-4,6-dideoxygalactose transaminase